MNAVKMGIAFLQRCLILEEIPLIGGEREREREREICTIPMCIQGTPDASR